MSPLPVDTAQVRAHIDRHPGRYGGAYRLIAALCDEIDRLRLALAAARRGPGGGGPG